MLKKKKKSGKRLQRKNKTKQNKKNPQLLTYPPPTWNPILRQVGVLYSALCILHYAFCIMQILHSTFCICIWLCRLYLQAASRLCSLWRQHIMSFFSLSFSFFHFPSFFFHSFLFSFMSNQYWMIHNQLAHVKIATTPQRSVHRRSPDRAKNMGSFRNLTHLSDTLT